MAKAETQRRKAQPRVREVIDVLHEVFPPTLAEPWDNVGLQLGEPDAPVNRVFIALDPTLGAVRQAGHDAALITHHPLFFGELPRRFDFSTPLGRIIQHAARKNIAIIAAHTNADWGAGGINDFLAAKLGLIDVRPWQPTYPQEFRKLVVFVPASHLERVSEAIFRAGGGAIGDYAKCSFRSPGHGTYLPLVGADPFAGKVGELSVEPETRLEVRVPVERLDAVLAAMKAAHPYQEVAFDVYSTERQSPQGGRGRLGRLAKPLTLAAFARRAAKILHVRGGRLIGDPKTAVKQVLVCGGAAASLLDELPLRSPIVLVTGDVKYHEARRARERGLAVVDLGHYGTELPFVKLVAARLAAMLAERGCAIPVRACAPEGDPFQLV
jgi:dinuclear metal center YbgI/SA1388 family protein